jgi:hypothetical protein
VPEQIELTSADLNNPPATIVSLEVIFLYIYMAHLQPREYTFDTQSQIILSNLFDAQGNYARQANRNTQYFVS